MKTTIGVMTLMLVAAGAVAPASANWFASPRTGINLNIGSAPNPTPFDLRAIGDSPYPIPPAPYRYRSPYPLRPTYRRPRPAALGPAAMIPPGIVRRDLARLEGRTVYGANGHELGDIVAVNPAAGRVRVNTREGMSVSMPAFLLVERGNRIVAPTTSMRDIRDMARL